MRGSGKPGKKFIAGLRFLFVVRKRKNFRSEPRFEITANGRPRKIKHIGNHAMGSEDDQAFAARVDKSHHGTLVVRVGIV